MLFHTLFYNWENLENGTKFIMLSSIGNELRYILIALFSSDSREVAKLIEQGFRPTPEQWQKLCEAPDNSTTLAIVREIKGTEPRKSAVLIFIDKVGHLSASQDGEMIEIGMFYADALRSTLGARAIKRIIDDSRIMEKNG